MDVSGKVTVGDVAVGSATGEFDFTWDLKGLRPTLKTTLGKYPASDVVPPSGTVAIEDQPDGSLNVYYDMQGLVGKAAASGRVSIHTGTSCNDNHANGVRDPYWNTEMYPADPWNASYSVTEGGTAKGVLKVTTGFSLDDNNGHVVVVQTGAGVRLACGALTVATGGLHIHTGTGCTNEKAAGGQYWKDSDTTENPWDNVRYSSRETEAKGAARVASGYKLAYNANHAVVVHSAADGSQIGCGVIEVWLENTTTTTTSATTTTTSGTTTTVVCNGKPDPAEPCTTLSASAGSSCIFEEAQTLCPVLCNTCNYTTSTATTTTAVNCNGELDPTKCSLLKESNCYDPPPFGQLTKNLCPVLCASCTTSTTTTSTTTTSTYTSTTTTSTYTNTTITSTTTTASTTSKTATSTTTIKLCPCPFNPKVIFCPCPDQDDGADDQGEDDGNASNASGEESARNTAGGSWNSTSGTIGQTVPAPEGAIGNTTQAPSSVFAGFNASVGSVPSAKKVSKRIRTIIIASATSGSILLLIIVMLICCCCKKCSDAKPKSSPYDSVGILPGRIDAGLGTNTRPNQDQEWNQMSFLEPEKQLDGRPLSGVGHMTAVTETVFGSEPTAPRENQAQAQVQAHALNSGSPNGGGNYAVDDDDDGFELPIALMLSKRSGTARTEAPNSSGLTAEPRVDSIALPNTVLEIPLWVHTHRMLYAFTASGSNQLTCAAGARVKVLFRQSAEWWDVELKSNGPHGIVPSSYLAEDAPVTAAAQPNAVAESVGTASPPAPRVATVAAASAVSPARPALHNPFAPTSATHYVSHEYTAASAAEVSVSRGQHVTLISETGEWSKIKVLSSGLEGYIPGSFLKGILTAPPPAPAAVAVVAVAPVLEAVAPAQVPGPAWGQAVNAGEVHVAEHDWQGTHASHISFSAGDFISVVEKDLGGGWWKGSPILSAGYPKTTGLFPGSYCREVTSAEQTFVANLQGGSSAEAEQEAAPPAPEPTVAVLAPVVKTRPFSIAAPPKNNGTLAAPVAKARPLSVVPTMVPSIARVIALFEYEPVKDDELAFVEGDHIDVTQMNDDGWYSGFVLKADGSRGDSGFFPENYVEQMGVSEA